MSTVRRTKMNAIEFMRDTYPIGSQWIHKGQTYKVWEVGGDPNEFFSFCTWLRMEGIDGDQIMLYPDEAEQLEEMPTALVCVS